MLWVEVVTACIPGYVAAAIYVHRVWHRIKYNRCLTNIRALEADLGMGGAGRSARTAANAWQAAASAKAANYSNGIVGAAVQAQADMLSNFNQSITSGRWASNLNSLGSSPQTSRYD